MNIEELRRITLTLPKVTEDIKWGNDLCFCIGEKMFCVTGLEGEFKASLKVENDNFEALCARPHISPAPYLARYKWVLIDGKAQLSDEEWKTLVETSYRLVRDKLPAKIRKALV
jgi:predicted DNA-binding protein (MmcQ/YjbR family)